METINRGRLTQIKELGLKIVDGTVSTDELLKIKNDFIQSNKFTCEVNESELNAVARIAQAEENIMNDFKKEIDESLRRFLTIIDKEQRYESFAAIFNEAFEKIDDALKEDLRKEYNVKLSK